MDAANRYAVNPPSSKEVAHLHASNGKGFQFFLLVSALTIVASWLALSFNIVGWICAQAIFALTFTQWFMLLHEAGHYTLFRHRALNRVVGHIAGLFALIPYESWQRIHARHHRWTGWQDLDVTTAALVPRQLSGVERIAINFAWNTYLPLFSVLYRVQNFWNPWCLRRYVSREIGHRIVFNAVMVVLMYVALFSFFGVVPVLKLGGVGLVLSLITQDLLLLSQHAHIPQRISNARAVKPHTPSEQQAFTRSLQFPEWFSWLILHFNAHELHHMYVQVPGYHLRKINYRPTNEVHWWTWLRGVKRMRGDVFLFQNSDQTGFRL